MTTLANAAAAGNAAVNALNWAQILQLQGALSGTVNAPPSLKYPFAFVSPTAAAGGNGSAARPWATLDDVAAGLVALEANATTGDPINVVMAPGTYAANSKPFTRPVNIVLQQGARFATGVVGLPVSIPTRTAATVLVTAWGIQRAPDALGASGLPTDPAVTGLPPFVFTVATPALYLGSSVTYRGNPPSLAGTDMVLRAEAVIPSGWVAALANVNAAAGVDAAGATLFADDSTLGDTNAAVLVTEGGQVGGAVVVTTSAATRGTDLSFVTAWTGPCRTDTLGWRGLQNAAVTPTGAVSFLPGTVVSERFATTPSPMTITLPGTFESAVDAVISCEAGDATTFANVTSSTATTVVVTFGGTAPVAFRVHAQG